MTEPLEPLRPITAKQQDEFGWRRETASVVQHKCATCNAWYETAKRATAYQEMFRCDCGQPMTFPVPALDYRRISGGPLDMDERLESGMEVREAIASACYWWNKTGRHQVRKDGAKGHDLSFSVDPQNPNFVPSGILNGEPWDLLNSREKVQVTKAWHFYYISKPQTGEGE